MNNLAVTALVLSVISLLGLDDAIIGLFPALVAMGNGMLIVLVLFAVPVISLILGVNAFRKIKEFGGKGKMIAIIAIAISLYNLIGVVFFLGLSFLIAGPN